MLSPDFSTNCAPNFIKNTYILITLGNTMRMPKTKDLSVKSLTITLKLGFKTMFFSINSGPRCPNKANMLMSGFVILSLLLSSTS